MNTTDENEAMYAKKYRMMKKKLRLLVYEREAFLEELKKSQRKLLKINRDKSFLLDRLIAYEQARATESTSDSESTASSDSEQMSAAKDKKRKLAHPATAAQSSARIAMSDQSLAQKKKSPASAAKTKAALKHNVRMIPPPMMTSALSGSLTREEVERRLEMKRSNQPQFMNIGVTPNSLPDDIFSHDNSNPLPNISADGSDLMDSVKIKVEEDDDANLIIDMAN